MKKIIFACIHSAGRSQMAAALFNQLARAGEYRAEAAGTQPATCIHPEVIIVMNEVGIDLSAAKPKLLTQELASKAQLLITLGCKENCPHVRGLKIEDWPLTDPKGKSLDEVRKIRDEIKEKVKTLITKL